MKPASFGYARPNSLAEALAFVTIEDAKPIAGGQSLIPLLALRMAAPKLLVDISRISELKGVEFGPEYIRLGALTRWCEILKDPQLALQHPLLVEAIGHTAHYQIRNRGTIGGSCSHADPSAEMPAIAVTCEAQFEVSSIRGTRIISAHDFFVSILTTALEADELVVSIRLPAWPSKRRYAFQEFSRRVGDFAMAGCAVFWDEEDGCCVNPHVGVFGVADTPLRVLEVEAVLAGRAVTPSVVADATSILREVVVPQDDVHAPSDYRSALLGVLLERALLSASAHPIAKAA
jgi:aerobic carbon-monoxide dehydrogenase medium subunit